MVKYAGLDVHKRIYDLIREGLTLHGHTAIFTILYRRLK